jgi:hypothetical protein
VDGGLEASIEPASAVSVSMFEVLTIDLPFQLLVHRVYDAV